MPESLRECQDTGRFPGTSAVRGHVCVFGATTVVLSNEMNEQCSADILEESLEWHGAIVTQVGLAHASGLQREKVSYVR